MITAPIEIYTDGSSIRNPGPSGLGYMIRYWNEPDVREDNVKVIEGNQGFRLSTNNRMEILACIYALKKVLEDDTTFQGATQINIFSDSEYLVKAVSQRWIEKWQQNNWMTSGYNGKQPSAVKNKDLWELLINTRQMLNNKGIIMTLSHVKGHDDNQYNNRVDRLAVQASTGDNQIIDEEYEKTLRDNYNKN